MIVTVPGEELKGLVVGLAAKSLTVDSDTTVTIEVGEPLIVCGAPNITNEPPIVATHGARIAGGHKIKRGKLRGVSLQGMISYKNRWCQT